MNLLLLLFAALAAPLFASGLHHKPSTAALSSSGNGSSRLLAPDAAAPAALLQAHHFERLARHAPILQAVGQQAAVGDAARAAAAAAAAAVHPFRRGLGAIFPGSRLRQEREQRERDKIRKQLEFPPIPGSPATPAVPPPGRGGLLSGFGAASQRLMEQLEEMRRPPYRPPRPLSSPLSEAIPRLNNISGNIGDYERERERDKENARKLLGRVFGDAAAAGAAPAHKLRRGRRVGSPKRPARQPAADAAAAEPSGAETAEGQTEQEEAAAAPAEEAAAAPSVKSIAPTLFTDQQAEQYLSEVATATAHNTHLQEILKRRATSAFSSDPVGTAALRVLASTAGGGRGALLYDVRDASTGALITDKLTLTSEKVLGSGGNGVVVQMRLSNGDDQQQLGLTTVAVKLAYFRVNSPDPSPDERKHARAVLKDIYKSEVDGVQRILRRARRGSGAGAAEELTTQRIAVGHQWAMPLFTASLRNPNGQPEQQDEGEQQQRLRGAQGPAVAAPAPKASKDDPLFVGRVGFYSKVVLSEVMLGDATSLLTPRDSTVTMNSKNTTTRLSLTFLRPSMSAMEYLCAVFMGSVAALNSLQVGHMDLKPENILISPSGVPYTADFGLAGPLGETRSCYNGTVLYMEPRAADCALRRRSRELKKTYDAWATGVTAYVMLSGGSFPYGINPNGSVLEQLSELDSPRGGSRRHHHTGRGYNIFGSPSEDLRRRGVSKPLADAVGALLNTDSHARPSVESICQKLGIQY